MTPRGFDETVVARRLDHAARLAQVLEQLQGHSASQLEADDVTRLATERAFCQVVQAMSDAAGHVCVSYWQLPTRYAAEHFRGLAERGVIAAQLSERLSRLSACATS